jgi:hypothetical protein
MMEYNTQKPLLRIPEYGRNVQMLIEEVLQITDRAERSKMANSIANLMASQNPTLKSQPEYMQRIWDHLHIIAQYKLDVDSPFPKPEPPVKSYLKKRKVDYIKKEHKYHFYGSNVELLIKKILAIEEGETRNKLISQVVAYMRLCYHQWNNDKVSDDIIIRHLGELSKGRIVLDKLPESNFRPPVERTYQKDYRKFKPRGNFSNRRNQR